MCNIDVFKGHGCSVLHGIGASAGMAETAFTAERDKLKLPAVWATVHSPARSGYAAVNHFLHVFNAVGQAAQPIISENYNMHNWERIKETRKYSLWTVAVFDVLWTASVLLFPNTFVKIFMSPTDSVLQIAPGIMHIYGLAYLLLPLNIFATYYFQSVMQLMLESEAENDWRDPYCAECVSGTPCPVTGK